MAVILKTKIKIQKQLNVRLEETPQSVERIYSYTHIYCYPNRHFQNRIYSISNTIAFVVKFNKFPMFTIVSKPSF